MSRGILNFYKLYTNNFVKNDQKVEIAKTLWFIAVFVVKQSQRTKICQGFFQKCAFVFCDFQDKNPIICNVKLSLRGIVR